ncbi:hypothetical protein YQ44_13075 [Janthinobacterium sp. 1_2014MBL_MicDiv]|nr:hypothetical protein YQ44_13075 [Janthinobacterium sp. 1_2014MBL_MicDiv]
MIIGAQVFDHRHEQLLLTAEVATGGDVLAACLGHEGTVPLIDLTWKLPLRIAFPKIINKFNIKLILECQGDQAHIVRYACSKISIFSYSINLLVRRLSDLPDRAIFRRAR